MSLYSRLSYLTISIAAERKVEKGDDDGADPPDPGPIKKPIAGPSRPPETAPKDDSSDDDGEFIGPPMPPNLDAANISDKTRKSDEDDDSEDDDEDDGNSVKKIPASHEVLLDHGDRTVSALTLDPAGSRLCTGGMDYYVKFWDFAGMDASLRSFRSIKPCESHPIKSLEYSATGENILIVSGNSQAKVVDRNGFEVLECVKGDQYLMDMARTKVIHTRSSHSFFDPIITIAEDSVNCLAEIKCTSMSNVSQIYAHEFDLKYHKDS